MNVNDTIKHLQSLVADDPAVGELEIAQQSCFDAPYLWESNGIEVGVMYTLSDSGGVLATFDSEESCQERVESDELTDVHIIPKTVLVIGAF